VLLLRNLRARALRIVDNVDDVRASLRRWSTESEPDVSSKRWNASSATRTRCARGPLALEARGGRTRSRRRRETRRLTNWFRSPPAAVGADPAEIDLQNFVRFGTKKKAGSSARGCSAWHYRRTRRRPDGKASTRGGVEARRVEARSVKADYVGETCREPPWTAPPKSDRETASSLGVSWRRTVIDLAAGTGRYGRPMLDSSGRGRHGRGARSRRCVSIVACEVRGGVRGRVASRARARRTCDASRETGYRLPAFHAF
jgi:hypothetical protein